MDIRHCPFCGPGKSKVSCDETEDGFYLQVGCGACGARSGVVLAARPGARERVLDYWNNRPGDAVNYVAAESIEDAAQHLNAYQIHSELIRAQKQLKMDYLQGCKVFRIDSIITELV